MRTSAAYLALVLLACPAWSANDLLSAAREFRSDVEWQINSQVIGDFDCDGRPDVAFIGKSRHEVVLVVFRRGDRSRPDSIAWQIGSFQFSSLKLSVEKLDVKDSEFEQMLGSAPEGYRRSTRCLGLQLSDGDRDSVHLYWHKRRNEFGAWSL